MSITIVSASGRDVCRRKQCFDEDGRISAREMERFATSRFFGRKWCDWYCVDNANVFDENYSQYWTSHAATLDSHPDSLCPGGNRPIQIRFEQAAHPDSLRLIRSSMCRDLPDCLYVGHFVAAHPDLIPQHGWASVVSSNEVSVMRETTMNPEKELRRLGLKVTHPRLKVLEIFRVQTGSHLCAEEVFRLLIEQGEEIGLATVYRVLAQLDEAGAISRQVFDGTKSVYEINNGEHHDHLVCLKCGRVREFDDSLIETRQQEIAALNGYRLAQHNLTLYGYCPDCEPEAAN